MVPFTVRAQVVDIPAQRMFPGEVEVRDGIITALREVDGPVEGYLIPGFVDAHVHVESSMLIPSEFARLAVTHGTVATVSDPHEIANVLGEAGVEFIIDNGRKVPFHFFFGAPACVPATVFETAGAKLDADAVGRLLEREEVRYLSEMMDFPGVLNGDPQVMAKIAHAHRLGKPVDGHAPGLRGALAQRYAAAGLPAGQVGISTDHECFTREEAADKLACGMKILVREGSAAKNFEALADLLHDHADRMMFCSDDKHPDGLVLGHINDLCARAVAKGIDVFKVLRAACVNPVEHYGLPLGRLRVGDPADMVLLADLDRFRAVRTWVKGELVAEQGRTFIRSVESERPNHFRRSPTRAEDFALPAQAEDLLVIEALDGQLITRRRTLPPVVKEGRCVADPSSGLLKIAVVDRYHEAPVAVGWITGFGPMRGAIAGSVAHDSHNIVVVGSHDEEVSIAVNMVVEARGGISLVDGPHRRLLPLPVAGLMTDADAYTVADAYSVIDREAKGMGCSLAAPYMTLSFMALLVIPALKMSDLGLFDGEAFRLVKAG